MQTRPFGATGKSVPLLGFGGARLPETRTWRFDLEKSAPVIRRAIDLGVTYIDSAHVYGAGTSEKAIGLAIQGYDRSRLFLTTKIPSTTPAQVRPSVWRKRLDLSLRRLDTPYVDFLFLHGIEWRSFVDQAAKPRHALDAARQAQAEGLFRHLCFSSHDTPENIIRLIDTGEFEGILVQYNCLDRHNEAAIAHAAARGLGVSIMGPLAAGLLVRQPSTLHWPHEPAMSAPELALRFVWSNPNVTVALSGMSNEAQVEHNVAAAGRYGSLAEAERRQTEAFFASQQQLSDRYCTTCGACLPCPRRVNIPENLRYMNWARVWGLEPAARDAYARLNGRARWEPWGKISGRKAGACDACGECEPRCPWHIPIIAQLKEAAETLGEQP